MATSASDSDDVFNTNQAFSLIKSMAKILRDKIGKSIFYRSLNEFQESL